MHTIHRLCKVCIAQSLPQVSIVRGKDGFGFTICSECPVRVQSVEPDGPAQQAGLQQSDSVLQLNGVPVESWKCVDLAHAIRSCSSQIVLVVWRGAPEIRPCFEGILHQPSYQPLSCQQPPLHHKATVEKLLPHPPNSKHGRWRGQGSGLRSGLGALGSLWRDKRDVKEEDEVSEFSSTITTLKGTHVTSSNGDNYIILSPVNQGGQLQPVYRDRNGLMGRLYKTHPTGGLHQQNSHLLHDLRPGPSQQSLNSYTATMPPLSFSTQPGNYGNYQNCTMVQSHLPYSAYGTYVSLSPKTLIFPVFVQPLDLCSPDRSLLMSEEMILHQGDLLPAKVTVLIYNDLLLLTREEEAGHCNVLQSPLYLHTLHLQEVTSEPLRLCVLQCGDRWECAFILEAYSLEQKMRVTLCLQDNISQQVAFSTEPTHTQQAPLEELESDFGLLSLSQTDFPCRSSSHYTSSPDQNLLSSFSVTPLTPPLLLQSSPLAPSPSPHYTSLLEKSAETSIWVKKEKGEGLKGRRKQSETTHEEEMEERRWRKMRGEAKEERQQGEGESSSETSERAPCLHTSSSFKDEEDSDEDNEEGGVGIENSSPFRTGGPTSICRSLSEGSLFQEPPSPIFLSDSTIHRLTEHKDGDFDLPNHPDSLNALRGHLTKDGGSLHQMVQLLTRGKDMDSAPKQIKKNRHLRRLAYVPQRNGLHGNSLKKSLQNNRPSSEEVLSWAEDFQALLASRYGLAIFRHFLRSEFSEENLDFWVAVEKYKTCPFNKMATRAIKIYHEYISTKAARQVNVDSSVREQTSQTIRKGASPSSFQLAQEQIYSLMESDSYPRFLKSSLYTQIANHNTQDLQTANQNHKGSTILANQQRATSIHLTSQERPSL